MSHKQVLDNQKFISIVAGLQEYRIDHFIRTIEQVQGSNKGNILPFIRGLRFSSLLTYTIRDFLSGSDLEANWGHIIDEEGKYCSRECDIIIHQKGHWGQWNGDGGSNHIMDFRFIEYEKAEIVISCKSYLTKSDIEKDYCSDMRQYVDRIWLFAECCGPESVDVIRKEAQSYGYEHFWPLYTWNRKTGDTVNRKDDWSNFAEVVRGLY